MLTHYNPSDEDSMIKSNIGLNGAHKEINEADIKVDLQPEEKKDQFLNDVILFHSVPKSD